MDFFKLINDNFGHLVGDKVLQEIANILKDNIRNIDIAARWGGEEFLIILPISSKEEAFIVASKLKENIANYTFSHGKQVTVSIGAVELQKDYSINETISKADEALYQSKNEGRNKVTMQ